MIMILNNQVSHEYHNKSRTCGIYYFISVWSRLYRNIFSSRWHAIKRGLRIFAKASYLKIFIVILYLLFSGFRGPFLLWLISFPLNSCSSFSAHPNYPWFPDDTCWSWTAHFHFLPGYSSLFITIKNEKIIPYKKALIAGYLDLVLFFGNSYL